MITCNNMNIWVGSRELLHHLNFTVNTGQKVALVGTNGAGKTTLLNTFKLSPTESKLHFGDSLQIAPVPIAWVEQEVPNTSESALEYTINGDHQYAYWTKVLNNALTSHQQDLITQANAKLDELDAWTINSRASIILTGLGFSQEQMQQPVNSLSGGWRIRLNLARALLVYSELLLLDEPTNHLDIDAIYWLENYLKRYQGTIIFISHDQEFMDNLADHVLHINNGSIDSYTGNYTAFLRQRQDKLKHQQQAYTQQQKHIKHLESFIERFRSKATKAKQAQSRIKMLQKLELIDPVILTNPFKFKFEDGERLPSVLASFRNVELGYTSGKPILQQVNFSLLPGMRIGLLGVNGAGKSTLIKAFAGELQPLDNQGSIELNQLVKMGYFNQYVVDKLDLQATPIETMRRLDNKLLEVDIRKFLAGFNFKGDKVFDKIESFSGGEKSRLALALIVYQKPNLLLLDEPTNHLDLEMRQALVNALQDFAGSLIVVSHDRFLLSAVVDQFYLVRQGTVTPFNGDLDSYYSLVIQDNKQAQQQNNSNKNNSTSTNSNLTKVTNNSNSPSNHLNNLNCNNTTNQVDYETVKAQVLSDLRLAKELRKQLLPLTQAQNKLLSQIDIIKIELDAITNAYLDPEINSNGTLIQELVIKEATFKQDLEQLEEEWLMIEMDIEEQTTKFVTKHLNS